MRRTSQTLCAASTALGVLVGRLARPGICRPGKVSGRRTRRFSRWPNSGPPSRRSSRPTLRRAHRTACLTSRASGAEPAGTSSSMSKGTMSCWTSRHRPRRAASRIHRIRKSPTCRWARAKFLEHLKGLGRGWPTDEVPKGGPRSYLHSRQLCIPAVSRKIVDGGQEIVQKPGLFMILSDDDWYRVIHTDGRPHTSPHAKSWFGSARGRWEGDTLVIVFTNLNALGWFDYSRKLLHRECDD